MDVMFYEVYQEEEVLLTRYLPKELTAGFSKKTVQAEKGRHPPSKLIAIRTQSLVPLSWVSELSGVLTRSSGFDHLLPLQSQKGKTPSLGYLPSYCSRAVAEHALMILLTLARKLKRQEKQFPTFNRDGLTGIECLGREALVVGVGRLGTEIVRLFSGIGMKVRGVDVVKRLKTLAYVPLNKGIRTADVVVCALPLTRATRRLLGYKCLRHAKKGAIFMNVSRGEISPSKELKRLLEEGILGGVGLDVYEGEGSFAESLRTKKGTLGESGKATVALLKDERVVLTPHNAFNTKEALERKAQQSVASIVLFLKKGTFPNPVPLFT